MQRHPPIASATAALIIWALPASAELPSLEPEIASAYSKAPRIRVPAPATWFLIEARNHATGASGSVAMLFGIATERGRGRQAILRVDCFERRTTVQIEAPGRHLGASDVAVRQSLDGGPLVSAAWDASADGGGLELSDERAMAFLATLYGKSELRLALVRPLSVPFWFTFAVTGAEAALGAIAERCHWPH
jgi:hypothetical protein